MFRYAFSPIVASVRGLSSIATEAASKAASQLGAEGSMNLSETRKFATDIFKTKRPKRPASAYITFGIEYRKKIREGSDYTPEAVRLSTVAAAWRNLDNKTRSMYEARVAPTFEKYNAECAAHKKTAPPRIPSSFIMFSNEHREEILADHPNMTFSEQGIELGRRWRALSDSERQRYVTRAAEQLKVYKKSLAAYIEREAPEKTTVLEK